MDNNGNTQYGSDGTTDAGNNPNGSGRDVSSKKLQQTHAQVNEVVDIMRENVEKVIDRDVKLSELDDRADALQQGASQFETQAAALKRKYWWKNMQMWIMLGAVCLVVVGVIFMKYKGSDDNKYQNFRDEYIRGPPMNEFRQREEMARQAVPEKEETVVTTESDSLER